GVAGFVAEGSQVPEKAHAMLAAKKLIALDAPFVGGSDQRAAGDDVVLADIAARPGRETSIGLHLLSKNSDGFRDTRETRGRNLVVGKRHADKPGAAGIRLRGARVIDRDEAVILIHPVAEIAPVHLGRRDGKDRIVGSNSVPEALIGNKE